MNPNPIALGLIALIIILALILWRSFRRQPTAEGTCQCGKGVTLIAGHCPCGGAGFEKSRERSFN